MVSRGKTDWKNMKSTEERIALCGTPIDGVTKFPKDWFNFTQAFLRLEKL